MTLPHPLSRLFARLSSWLLVREPVKPEPVTDAASELSDDQRQVLAFIIEEGWES